MYNPQSIVWLFNYKGLYFFQIFVGQNKSQYFSYNNNKNHANRTAVKVVPAANRIGNGLVASFT